MCGIAGEINWRNEALPDNVRKLIEGISHRGPDDFGVWHSSNKKCALGHARLSIVDLSQAGHQPMIDPQTGNTIVFNGEIYNHKILRADCEKAGENFKSHTDTEVILVLYRKYGTECLKYLRGMFAFAIWDEKENILFMARDRLGKKPLNYALTENGLALCSEINPLAHHPDANSDMDPDGLDFFLQLQYIPAPWTIYKGIKKLPPAHFAIFSSNGIQITQYWDVDYKKKIKIDEKEALNCFEEKLKESVKLRMEADVSVGALLSGGVDSSVIVALMAESTAGKVKTFSIGFAEESFNELPYAQQVADKFSTEHHPEIVSGDVESLLSDIVKHYGEPFADSSAVPSFHVSKNARKHMKVVLNGDGGDELLGGYPRYYLSDTVVNLAAALPQIHSNRELAHWSANLYRAQSISERLKRKWLLRAANPEVQSVAMYSEFWNDSERASLTRNKSSLLENWRTDWLDKAGINAANPIDRMLYIDNRTYLPGDLLVKMDIASMHCGLEARSPLLDQEVIEFCATLPVNLKVQKQTGKYLLKKLAERYFPKEFVYRKKMGFGIPLEKWLQGPLRGLVHDVLSDARIMEPLNMADINETLAEFYQFNKPHGSRIWALLMFGLWRHVCVLGRAA